ncbi:Ig-like domain-containing protein, partial [Acinetobacter gerneri]|uniref:Ig-like domain-containing protein n=1 Tax=Acinetobacter gerneri TaxID=202952 RepID=UPI0005A6786E
YPAGQVQVREVDPAGNISNAYEMGHLQVYNGAPPQPQASLVNDTGVDNNDQITTDGTLQITGILPGFTWKYSLDGGTTFVDGSSDNLLVLPAGTYDNVMIFQVNDIGSSGTAWNTGEIEVVAPITLGLSLAADTGSSATDGITSNGTINVTGINQSASTGTWEYSTDGGTTWTPGSGTSFTLPSDGTYAADQIQVRQSNPALDAPSVSKLGEAVVIDTQLPTAPEILNVSAADVVTGTAEKNSVVTVKFADNTTEIVTVSSTGTWSVTHPGIVNGSTITATATDTAGNISPEASKVVDNSAPATPTGYVDNVAPEEGTFASGTSTNDTTPGVLIAAPAAGETPKLYVDGTEVPATYDPVTGTLTPDAPLGEGKHDLTYTLTDSNGFESVPSGILSLTVDTQTPVAPTAALVSDTGIPGDGVTSYGEVAVTLTDSGIDNWQYSTDGGVTWSTVQTANNNRFTLADGDYPAGQVQVREVDPAGNASDAYLLGHLQVYNGAPPQPQAYLVNDTGADDNDQITTDGTLQITGILPGFTWSYSIDDGPFITGSSDNLLVLPIGTYDNIMISQVNDIGSSGQAWNTGRIEVVASDSGSVVAPFAAFSALEDTTPSNTTETSTSANDTFNSTASQHNTVIFNVLNNADATGGNGQDTWNGFTVTPTDASSTVQSTQDVIDVTKLLSGQSVDATNISKFVTSVTVNNTEGGKDTVIAIDRDGAGGSFNSTDILTLKNVDTTVDELIKNHQLLY